MNDYLRIPRNYHGMTWAMQALCVAHSPDRCRVRIVDTMLPLENTPNPYTWLYSGDEGVILRKDKHSCTASAVFVMMDAYLDDRRDPGAAAEADYCTCYGVSAKPAAPVAAGERATADDLAPELATWYLSRGQFLASTGGGLPKDAEAFQPVVQQANRRPGHFTYRLEWIKVADDKGKPTEHSKYFKTRLLHPGAAPDNPSIRDRDRSVDGSIHNQLDAMRAEIARYVESTSQLKCVGMTVEAGLDESGRLWLTSVQRMETIRPPPARFPRDPGLEPPADPQTTLRDVADPVSLAAEGLGGGEWGEEEDPFEAGPGAPTMPTGLANSFLALDGPSALLSAGESAARPPWERHSLLRGAGDDFLPDAVFEPLCPADVEALARQRSPPPTLKFLVSALFVLTTGKSITWERARRALRDGGRVLRAMAAMNPNAVPLRRIRLMYRQLESPAFELQAMAALSVSAARLSRWVAAAIEDALRAGASTRGHVAAAAPPGHEAAPGMRWMDRAGATSPAAADGSQAAGARSRSPGRSAASPARGGTSPGVQPRLAAGRALLHTASGARHSGGSGPPVSPVRLDGTLTASLVHGEEGGLNDPARPQEPTRTVRSSSFSYPVAHHPTESLDALNAPDDDGRDHADDDPSGLFPGSLLALQSVRQTQDLQRQMARGDTAAQEAAMSIELQSAAAASAAIGRVHATHMVRGLRQQAARDALPRPGAHEGGFLYDDSAPAPQAPGPDAANRTAADILANRRKRKKPVAKHPYEQEQALGREWAAGKAGKAGPLMAALAAKGKNKLLGAFQTPEQAAAAKRRAKELKKKQQERRPGAKPLKRDGRGRLVVPASAQTGSMARLSQTVASLAAGGAGGGSGRLPPPRDPRGAGRRRMLAHGSGSGSRLPLLATSTAAASPIRPVSAGAAGRATAAAGALPAVRTRRGRRSSSRSSLAGGAGLRLFQTSDPKTKISYCIVAPDGGLTQTAEEAAAAAVRLIAPPPAEIKRLLADLRRTDPAAAAAAELPDAPHAFVVLPDLFECHATLLPLLQPVAKRCGCCFLVVNSPGQAFTSFRGHPTGDPLRPARRPKPAEEGEEAGPSKEEEPAPPTGEGSEGFSGAGSTHLVSQLSLRESRVLGSPQASPGLQRSTRQSFLDSTFQRDADDPTLPANPKDACNAPGGDPRVLNNEFLGRCVLELLEHVDSTGEFPVTPRAIKRIVEAIARRRAERARARLEAKGTGAVSASAGRLAQFGLGGSAPGEANDASRPRTRRRQLHLLGFGNGASVAMLVALRRASFFGSTLRSVVAVAPISRVDARLGASLRSSMNVFSCFPAEKPELALSFFSKFLFSQAYLEKRTPEAVLSAYSSAPNPITLEGRVRLCAGALDHTDVEAGAPQLGVPIVVVQPTADALVRPEVGPAWLHGRQVSLFGGAGQDPSVSSRKALRLRPAEEAVAACPGAEGGRGGRVWLDAFGVVALWAGMHQRSGSTGALVWARGGHALHMEGREGLMQLLAVLSNPDEAAHEAEAAMAKSRALHAAEKEEAAREGRSAAARARLEESKGAGAAAAGGDEEDDGEEEGGLQHPLKMLNPAQMTFNAEKQRLRESWGFFDGEAAGGRSDEDAASAHLQSLSVLPGGEEEAEEAEAEAAEAGDEAGDGSRDEAVEAVGPTGLAEASHASQVLILDPSVDETAISGSIMPPPSPLGEAQAEPQLEPVAAVEEAGAGSLAAGSAGEDEEGGGGAMVQFDDGDPPEMPELVTLGAREQWLHKYNETKQYSIDRMVRYSGQQRTRRSRWTAEDTEMLDRLGADAVKAARRRRVDFAEREEAAEDVLEAVVKREAAIKAEGAAALADRNVEDEDLALLKGKLNEMLLSVRASELNMKDNPKELLGIATLKRVRTLNYADKRPPMRDVAGPAVYDEVVEETAQAHADLLRRQAEEYEERRRKYEELMRPLRWAAAVEVQRTWRGMQGRVTALRRRAYLQMLRAQRWAAVTVQRLARGHLGRLRAFRTRVRRLRREYIAHMAMRIQRSYRTYVSRCALRALLWNKCARTVQRYGRGFLARGLAARLRAAKAHRELCNKSATLIQSVWRRYVARVGFTELQVLTLAASDIQRTWRGRHGRIRAQERRQWLREEDPGTRLAVGVRILDRHLRAVRSNREDLTRLRRESDRLLMRAKRMRQREREVRRALVALKGEERRVAVMRSELDRFDRTRDGAEASIDAAVQQELETRRDPTRSRRTGVDYQAIQAAAAGLGLSLHGGLSALSAKRRKEKQQEHEVKVLRRRVRERAEEAFDTALAVRLRAAEVARNEQEVASQRSALEAQQALLLARAEALERHAAAVGKRLNRRKRHFSTLADTITDLMKAQEEEAAKIKERAVLTQERALQEQIAAMLEEARRRGRERTDRMAATVELRMEHALWGQVQAMLGHFVVGTTLLGAVEDGTVSTRAARLDDMHRDARRAQAMIAGGLDPGAGLEDGPQALAIEDGSQALAIEDGPAASAMPRLMDGSIGGASQQQLAVFGHDEHWQAGLGPSGQGSSSLLLEQERLEREASRRAAAQRIAEGLARAEKARGGALSLLERSGLGHHERERGVDYSWVHGAFRAKALPPVRTAAEQLDDAAWRKHQEAKEAAALTARRDAEDEAAAEEAEEERRLDELDRTAKDRSADFNKRVETFNISAAVGALPLDVRRWSVEDVCKWVSGIHLGKLAPALREAEVDGTALLELRPDEFRDVLGLESAYEQRRLDDARQRLAPPPEGQLREGAEGQRQAKWTQGRWLAHKQIVTMRDARKALGADLGVRKLSDGRTPNVGMLMALSRTGRIARLEECLACGLSPDARLDGDPDGGTTLHEAAKHKQRPAVEALMRYGADVNAIDSHGNTPLHYAMALDHSGEIADVLMDAGADTNIKNQDGLKPGKFLTAAERELHKMEEKRKRAQQLRQHKEALRKARRAGPAGASDGLPQQG